MKKCCKCKVEINENNAYKREGRLQPYCKECFNNIQKERWKKRKIDAIEYKGGKCERCGYNKYYGALEFHHRNPSEKDFQWNKLRLMSWDKIVKEINKCDLLCSNCHREVHNDIFLESKGEDNG